MARLHLTTYVSILAPPEGGAQPIDRDLSDRAIVSILAPPEGGAQRATSSTGSLPDGVSILAPPEGGAQRTCRSRLRAIRFQSSLRPKAERNDWRDVVIVPSIVFQSSLRPKAERNRSCPRRHADVVSILAPPEGGAQRCVRRWMLLVMFQSSLRPKAERNANVLATH